MPDVVHAFTEFAATHGYWVLFVGVMLENAGIPLPGETALLMAGYLSSPAGGSHLNIWAVILVTFAGAVVGDNLGYWAGRELARRRLAHGKSFLFLTPARLVHAEAYFAKYGALTVFFGRFVALLRIVAGPAAGVAGMAWWRFFIANAAGAAVWATTIGLLGYAAGPAWESLQAWLGRGAWVAAGAVVLGVLLWHLVPWRRRKPATTGPETAPV